MIDNRPGIPEEVKEKIFIPYLHNGERGLGVRKGFLPVARLIWNQKTVKDSVKSADSPGSGHSRLS